MKLNHGTWRTADVYAIGSLLHNFSNPKQRYMTSLLRLLNRNYPLVIWGTGSINNNPILLPKHNILALRGKKTAQILDFKKDIPFGDPALLVSEIIKPLPPNGKIGVIPHYVDKEHPYLEYIRNNDKYTIIDVEYHWKETVKQISSCSFVLSSSLHGIIVADSFKIPRHWIKLSNDVVGGGFKFHDHATVCGKTHLDFTEITSEKSLSEAASKVMSIEPALSEARLSEINRDLRSALKNHYS